MSASELLVHPERIDGSDAVLWRTTAAESLAPGLVTDAPGVFGELLRSGVIVEATVCSDGIVTQLGENCTWGEAGAEVRAAVVAALVAPNTEWQTATSATDSSELLAVIDSVFAGPAGDLIRLHGGSWSVESILDGTVTIKLSGACEGCPAVTFATGLKIDRALRAAHPAIERVITV